MNSIKYACSFNNQGVDLLVSGDYSKAMKAFQIALGLLKAAPEAETTSILCDDASASWPFCESTSTVPALQGLPCYVYDHGIMISDNINADTGEKLSLYIAIVLFNSALASHSEGTALGREKSLMKASVLYGLVVTFLTRCIMLEDTSTTILTLLALNNNAQIHYDQCEYVHSADCIKQISNIMGSARGLHSALSHEDIDGLVLNAMCMITPTAAHAA
jgi:hypothetical protein